MIIHTYKIKDWNHIRGPPSLGLGLRVGFGAASCLRAAAMQSTWLLSFFRGVGPKPSILGRFPAQPGPGGPGRGLGRGPAPFAPIFSPVNKF